MHWGRCLIRIRGHSITVADVVMDVHVMRAVAHVV